MWTATFVEADVASMVLLNGSPYEQCEDQVGMPSESSHISTGPLKRMLLFQLSSARKQVKFCMLRYDA